MAAVSGKLLPRKIADIPKHIANVTVAAPAAEAASLCRFLFSAALILLWLIRLRLILSASAMDTIRERPQQ